MREVIDNHSALVRSPAREELVVEPGMAPRRHGAAALDVLDVSARHGDRLAVDSVSFSVPRRALTAVVGPNGSGKTTLLDCISGLHPSTGSIWIDGWDVGRLRPDRRVTLGLARTFQTPVLVPDLDVLTNIRLGSHHWDTDNRGGVTEAESMAERLGLLALRHRAVTTLTHAERRLVEIARALVTRPRVLLLDEPAAGFNHDEGLALCRLIQTVAGELDATVLLVEHDVPLVMALADQVVVLDQGRVLAKGSPAAVRENPQVIDAYLGPNPA